MSMERSVANEEIGTRKEDARVHPPPATSSVLGPRSASPHPGTVQSEKFSFWYGPKQALHDITLTMPARSSRHDRTRPAARSRLPPSINALTHASSGTREGRILLDDEDIYARVRTLGTPPAFGMGFSMESGPKSIYDTWVRARINDSHRARARQIVETIAPTRGTLG